MSALPSAALTAAIDLAVDSLAAAPIGGYQSESEAASEPIACGAVALANAGRNDSAEIAAKWLVKRQAADGSVGVTESQDNPYWPTALAMLAWKKVDAAAYSRNIASGAQWALEQKPWTEPRVKKFGHDTSLAGWSWAPATHSWVEPTAYFVVALHEAGYADNPRRLEGVRLLVDRLLPSGGANSGNTVVFGQELLAHTQFSGVVAWALAGEEVNDVRLEKTIQRLKQVTDRPTGAASLAWAARGLAAHSQANAAIAEQIANKLTQSVEKNAGLYKTALLTLAAQEILKQPEGDL